MSGLDLPGRQDSDEPPTVPGVDPVPASGTGPGSPVPGFESPFPGSGPWPTGPVESTGPVEWTGPAGPGRPAARGAHRRAQGRDRRPWAWLVTATGLAVLAALGLAAAIGGSVRGPRPAPAAGPPAAESAPSTSTSTTAAPGPSSPATSPPSRTRPQPATVPPTPTAPTAPPASAVAPRRTAVPPAPRLVAVPDVVGDRLPAAEAALREAGLAAAVQRVPAPQRRLDRRVLAQRPEPGRPAPPGSVVTLLVGER